MNGRLSPFSLLTSHFSLFATLICFAVGGGCAVGPNYHSPETSTPPTWSGIQPSTTTQPAGPTTRPAELTGWWRTLKDPKLDSLIERATESNLNLRAANARVREARAQRGIAVADFWPQVNAAGGYTFRGSSINATPRPKSPSKLNNALRPPSVSIRPGTADPVTGVVGPPTITVNPASAVGSATIGGITASGSTGNFGGINFSSASGGSSSKISRNVNLFEAGFDAAWEIDVFGRIRRSVEASDAELEASQESERDALVTLLSEVALNYVQLRGSQRRLAIANDNIRSQQDTMELTRTRYEHGLTNELDYRQAEAQLATTQSIVPQLESAIKQSIYQLSVLLSQPPGALIDELLLDAPIPTAPPDVPIGLPSDLVRRRPDVRAAERQLAAATARIGVATADLFPRFSITGGFGPQSTDINHFLDNNSLMFSIGPSVRWPIFQGGRIHANIRLQEAFEEEALAGFQQIVLVAFQDVENALVAYVNEAVRHRTLDRAVRANQRATDLSNDLYTRGLAPFLNVLVSQRALSLSQDDLAQSETTAITNLIALYKALGGGWDADGGLQGSKN